MAGGYRCVFESLVICGTTSDKASVTRPGCWPRGDADTKKMELLTTTWRYQTWEHDEVESLAVCYTRKVSLAKRRGFKVSVNCVHVGVLLSHRFLVPKRLVDVFAILNREGACTRPTKAMWDFEPLMFLLARTWSNNYMIPCHFLWPCSLCARNSMGFKRSL